MALVALVALIIGATRELPPAIHHVRFCGQQAWIQASLEEDLREKARKSLERASSFHAEFERLQAEEGGADELTRRYFAGRWELEEDDARDYQSLASHHESAKQEYLRAQWSPWSPVPNQTSTPRDPTPFQGGFELTEGGIAVAFSPDGRTLAVGCWDQTVKILERPSYKVVASCRVPDTEPARLGFSPDGSALFAAGWDPPVWLWEFAGGETPRALPGIDRSPIQPDFSLTAAAWRRSPEGEMIAIAEGNFRGKPKPDVCLLRLLDARTGALEWEKRSPGSFIRSGSRIADGQLRMKWEKRSPGSFIRSVAFSPDGRTLACVNGAVLLLDTGTGRLQRALKPVAGNLVAVGFSPDGQTLAGAGSDPGKVRGPKGMGFVTLWDVATGRIVRTLEGPTGPADTVAFSPDGRSIAAGGSGPLRRRRGRLTRSRMDGPASEVRLWDAATGVLIWTAEGSYFGASSLSFAPDGQSLAYCDFDYVYLLDARTGRLRRIIMESNGRYR